MKKLLISLAVVTTFFLGVGSLAERSAARFKSDDKALELIRKARVAIGGDEAIANVKSMRIVGTMTQNVKVNGVETARTGETEIALMLPDKVMHVTRIGDGSDPKGDAQIDKQVDVVVVGGDKKDMKVRVDAAPNGEKKIIIRDGSGNEKVYTGAEADKFEAAHGGAAGPGGDVKRIVIRDKDGKEKVFTGAEADKIVGQAGPKVFKTEDGKTVVVDEKVRVAHGAGGMRANELLRLTLGLLLSSPQGMDVSYTYGGQGDLDGARANIVIASFGGQSFKLFLDATSNLPLGMTFTHAVPHIAKFKAGAPADGGKKDVVIIRSVGEPAGEAAEMTVKFSDYRSVDGLMVPFKWTHTGAMSGVIDITSFEINPANIADKFKNDKVMVRTPKPDGQ